MNIAHEIKTNIKADHIDDFIDLDYEGRFLRRKKLLSNKGEEFLVELPEAYSLSENDSFLLDDGRIIGINLKICIQILLFICINFGPLNC